MLKAHNKRVEAIFGSIYVVTTNATNPTHPVNLV